MNGAAVVWCLLICLVTVPKTSTEYTKTVDNVICEKNCSLQIFPGVTLRVEEERVSLNFKVQPLLLDNQLEARKRGKGQSVLQRIGGLIMLIPFTMQMLSLPGTLASLKTQLIRSLFMGKMALIIILYNALRSSLMAKEVVVVHQPPAQQHMHYYHPFEDDMDDDSKGSWWGR